MSRFLVDTQLLLWNVYGSRKLPARVARLFRDGRHQFFYSAASLWEIAVKASPGREDFVADTAAIRDTLEANGFQELPVVGQHAVALAGLPLIHGDPFDRMLVAQALVEPMALITSDARLAACPGRSRWSEPAFAVSPRGFPPPADPSAPDSCISSLSGRGARRGFLKCVHRQRTTHREPANDHRLLRLRDHRFLHRHRGQRGRVRDDARRAGLMLKPGTGSFFWSRFIEPGTGSFS